MGAVVKTTSTEYAVGPIVQMVVSLTAQEIDLLLSAIPVLPAAHGAQPVLADLKTQLAAAQAMVQG